MPIFKLKIRRVGWLTDENGNRYIEGPSGDLTLDVYGPTGSSYAPGQVSITVSESDTTKHTVQLVPAGDCIDRSRAIQWSSN